LARLTQSFSAAVQATGGPEGLAALDDGLEYGDT